MSVGIIYISYMNNRLFCGNINVKRLMCFMGDMNMHYKYKISIEEMYSI